MKCQWNSRCFRWKESTNPSKPDKSSSLICYNHDLIPAQILMESILSMNSITKSLSSLTDHSIDPAWYTVCNMDTTWEVELMTHGQTEEILFNGMTNDKLRGFILRINRASFTKTLCVFFQLTLTTQSKHKRDELSPTEGPDSISQLASDHSHCDLTVYSAPSTLRLTPLRLLMTSHTENTHTLFPMCALSHALTSCNTSTMKVC